MREGDRNPETRPKLQSRGYHRFWIIPAVEMLRGTSPPAREVDRSSDGPSNPLDYDDTEPLSGIIIIIISTDRVPNSTVLCRLDPAATCDALNVVSSLRWGSTDAALTRAGLPF
ncbi:jg21839 [Pararge aegeria aegeria]|uniref:Jg21839 protein n=1 Tax=Pararge aegeria aegeria TaxID=348720 RepID=A0A8S4QII9_9NEOP|nr:jg21839 [Pararge aegeria aegeria]